LIRSKSDADETAKKLKLFMDMTNETVGDAISDLLLVESILHARGWSIQDWNKSYQVIRILIYLLSYFCGAVDCSGSFHRKEGVM
jgi:hypothetical protein